MKKFFLMVICIFVVMHSNAQILQSQHNFDNDALDAIGNHHGTLVNGPTYTTDRFGNPNSAIQLDGINDYVDFANGLTLQGNTYTYDVWVKPYSNAGGGTAKCLLSIGGTGGDQTMNNANAAGIGWNAGGYVNPSGSYAIYSGVMPTINQWYHVTSIRDVTSHMLYVNGVLVASTAVGLGNTPKYGQNLAWLGRRTFIGGVGPQYFHGAIDDLKIYSGVNIPLPLDLISFTVVNENHSALLQWETANKKNVAGFEIEKSKDSKSFTKIGFVAAAETDHYSFTDTKLIDRNNYYRLRMIDQDGRFTYSNIISIVNSDRAEINLFPNPAKAELHIISSVSEYSYQIYDMFGKVVITGSANTQHSTIPCTLLHKGIYFVKVDLKDEVKILKFMHD